MRVENITSRPRSRFISSKEEEIERKVEKKAAGRWTSLMFSSSNDVERGKVREKSAQIIVSLTMSVTMGTDSRATISIFLAFTSAPFSDFILYMLPFAVVLIQSLHNTYLKRIYVRICVIYIYTFIRIHEVQPKWRGGAKNRFFIRSHPPAWLLVSFDKKNLFVW